MKCALKLPGCYGARLTGGGFEGSTVYLVRANFAEQFCESLRVAYQARFGVKAETYVCQAVDGAVARLSIEQGSGAC